MNPHGIAPTKFSSEARIVANVHWLNAYRTRADFTAQSKAKPRVPLKEEPLAESDFDLALEAAIQDLDKKS